MTATFSHLGSYGRLANGLFQIAATVGYARKHGDNFLFPKWQYQDAFEIGKLGCFGNPRCIQFSKYVEPKFAYTEIPKIQNIDLYGYFQSPKYFQHCEGEIKKLLTPSENKDDPAMFRGICSVHVRRGDYVHLSHCHPPLTMDYYRAAMDKVPASRFMIFSDDVAWCRENFGHDSRCIVTDPADPVVDFSLQRICNYNIIANSSFSWWAAWLNPHEDKVIVAPSKWFGPSLEKDHPTNDLIPESWVRV
jgi:hypothetical protein